ncbi:MAG: CCA tRNA nucleotidyltransferase, partial [Acidobacteria bacterium]|nr:CCA tRNA nucleotidyltransferase [Acidobacteriota bacterium]
MERAARRIVARLRRHGHEALFAGGCVRDRILRRRPQDIDIATSATPATVAALFPRSSMVGARYGVVQVKLYGRGYEVATFRTEGPYLDGRHPSSVEFATPVQDAHRRDFTVNALFYDPITDRVIDYVRGKADIRNRLIRTVGEPEARFNEDKLRMLRAVRFACSLGFRIEGRTWEAIREHAREITGVSGERIRDEILKILTGPDPARGLDLLSDSGLLRWVLPEVEAMRGVPQPREYHPEGDVFTHTRLALSFLRKPSPTLALATLLHDIGKPPTYAEEERIRFDGHVEVGARMAAEICRRLRLSNDQMEQIVDLIVHHLRFMHVKDMRVSTLRRFMAKPNFRDHLEMHRVDCMSSHRDMDSYRYCLGRLDELSRQPAPLVPLLRGRDLI